MFRVCGKRLSMIACLMMPSVSAAQSVRDSAAVEIVQNARALLPAARAWRVDAAPLLRIGAGNPTTEGDALYELYLTMGVVRLSDGRWAVGVQSTHTVRIYDARGRFVSSMGREGRGPGEFQQVMGVSTTRGDTLMVIDLDGMEWFTGSGQFIRPGAGRGRGTARYVYPAALMRDGSHAGFNLDDPRIPPAGRQLVRAPILYLRDNGTRSDTLAVVAAYEQVFDGRQRWGASLVYGALGLLTGDGTHVLHGVPGEYTIDVYAVDGRRVRSIRRTHTPVPVTEAAKSAYRAHVSKSPGEGEGPLSPEMRARLERALASAQFADHFPAVASLLADRTGNLWVQRYDPLVALRTPGPVRVQTIAAPTTWDVFDARGRWLTTVRLPARFTPQEIGADYVAGVARNEDDEESVLVLTLRRP